MVAKLCGIDHLEAVSLQHLFCMCTFWVSFAQPAALWGRGTPVAALRSCSARTRALPGPCTAQLNGNWFCSVSFSYQLPT